MSCISASQMCLVLMPLQKLHKELISGQDTQEENNCKQEAMH